MNEGLKNFILIPDSFKGSMTSAQICGVMEKVIRRYCPGAAIHSIPVADGGEGSVDAFLTACGGEKITLTVKGPYMEDMTAFYGILKNDADGPGGSKTAVIEMAACAGLPLVGDRLNPAKTSTYGVGQLMADAVKRGCTKIIMGLGGSATNDFGAGCAAGAGVAFFDKDGTEFIPVGESLSRIARVDLSGLPQELRQAEIITMCDIDNPLAGEQGAAFVFGPQKGASPAMVEKLDAGLRRLADVVARDTGRDLAAFPGAGAAGGMGYGVKALLGFDLRMGIETVLDTVDFDGKIAGADIVFSGEGKIDTQSLRGKVVSGVAKRTHRAGVPLVAVVGDIGDGIEEIYAQGVTAVFSTNRVAVDYRAARLRAKSDLALTMENILRFMAM